METRRLSGSYPLLARSIPNNIRKKKKRAKLLAAGIIVAASDNSRLNLRSALGIQLFRLWMYDYRECLNKLQADRARILCEPLAYRNGDALTRDYTLLY